MAARVVGVDRDAALIAEARVSHTAENLTYRSPGACASSSVPNLSTLNLFNIFSVRYNTNPLDANGNFGSYLPSDAGASSGTMRVSPPRSVQLGLKVFW